MQYNPEEYNEILNIFKTESDEIIQGLNDGFLALEKNPQNKKPIKKLLQLLHSLKGAARMLGFKSIQDIVHKIEDILFFWMKEDVQINMLFFKSIYGICDFLSEHTEKIVNQKSDIYDSNVSDFLNVLNNFITFNHMVPVQGLTINHNQKNNINSIDINAILLELIFILENESDENNNDEIIAVAAENLLKLSEMFLNSDFTEIKDQISNILETINSGQKNLDFYRQKITELRENIYKLNKDISLSTNIKEKKNKTLNEKTEIKENSKKKNIDEKFNYILSNLQKIKYKKESINKITDLLVDIRISTDNEKINFILNKTINILKIYETQGIIIDNDCYMVILQCIYLAKRIFDGNDEHLSNLNFLIQRLSLVEEMLNVSKEEQKNEVTAKQTSQIISQSNYENFNQNLTQFDIQEIKTLRVDITKLDNLISQTGELLINEIKYQEHVVNLAGIISNLTKWNIESKKILNYMKYYEKKKYFNSDNSDVSGIFLKKIQNFFTENVNMINELHSAFTTLYNNISEDDNKLHQTVLEIETIAKGIRVLPLAAIFHSFPRMIRDIAEEYGKKVDFYISGSDTTVDKKIIEEIKMPLIHILRNSISHGIESPSERVKNNKNETGIIRLTAKQAENNVIITIEDDGYGINIEKIKESALKKGILLQEEIKNMTNDQLMKLIFLPGFSTDESIDNISGRGVGLDIVKTKIANLNGDITIDSVLNKGCKVTLKVPLSMSTLKTFILLVNNQYFAIPIGAVKLVKRIKKEEIFSKDGQNCIIFEEHSIPILSISNIFGKPNQDFLNENILTIIIIELQGIQAAFIIDKLLGSQEVFQKKLVPPIIKIKNISGFTTLATGEICLIINPYELMRYSISNLQLPTAIIKQLM